MQGRYVALYELSWGLVGVLGPALFGITFDISPALPWLAVTAAVVAAMVLLRTAETRLRAPASSPVRVEHAA